MNSYTSPEFWEFYEELPEEIQILADKAYNFWCENPNLPGLQFKKLRGMEGWYLVRINENWRSVGYMHEYGITWVWIGSHADYNNLVKRLG